jgi:hypothetical protein
LVSRHGLAPERYNQLVAAAQYSNPPWPELNRFPEWALLELPQDWMTEVPDPREAGRYRANRAFVEELRKKVADATSDPQRKTLERLAQYLLSCIPGCRSGRAMRTYSTDLDVVCSAAGMDVDFRAEFGRYFVAECKSSDAGADVTDLLKFSRVLDSVKCRFGVLFAWNGISRGVSQQGEPRYALREELKVFLDRGIVLVVITKDHIRRVAEGESFVALLREEYEKTRFDVAPTVNTSGTPDP